MPFTLRHANYAVATFTFLCVMTLYSCSQEEVAPQENIRTAMLEAVNQLRRTGCRCGTDSMPPAPDLQWNDTLETAATSYVKYMYSHNYFSHISPDGSSPIQRAQEAGYKGDYVGENIARGYSTVKDVMVAWQNSEEHCKALMDTLYLEIGAAKYNSYWIQDFGRHLP